MKKELTEHQWRLLYLYANKTYDIFQRLQNLKPREDLEWDYKWAVESEKLEDEFEKYSDFLEDLVSAIIGHGRHCGRDFSNVFEKEPPSYSSIKRKFTSLMKIYDHWKTMDIENDEEERQIRLRLSSNHK